MVAEPTTTSPRHRMTIEEFWDLPEGPPYHEFENGELIEMPPPHGQHQRVVRDLLLAIDKYLDGEAMGEVLPGVGVDFPPSRSYVPDLVYVAEERSELHSDGVGRVQGAPALAVEVQSPSTVGRDRVTKMNAYAQAGVEWYWLVDPQALVIEEYRLEDGYYVRRRGADADETFESELFPGLSINLAERLKRRPGGSEQSSKE